MRKAAVILIFVIAILALGLMYLRHKADRRAHRKVVVGVVEQAPESESGLDLAKELALDLKNLDPEMKRIMVYFGHLNIPPPCPRDTHLDGDFCRKGDFKGDTDHIYIGTQFIKLDVGCRPDKCLEECQAACEALAGEDCWAVDALQEKCMKDHPLPPALTDADTIRKMTSSCVFDHQEEYAKYRCTFNIAEDKLAGQGPQPDSAIFKTCKSVYDELQACMQRFGVKLDDNKWIVSSYEGLENCYKASDQAFVDRGCEGIFSKDDRRFKDEPEEVECIVKCY